MCLCVCRYIERLIISDEEILGGEELFNDKSFPLQMSCNSEGGSKSDKASSSVQRNLELKPFFLTSTHSIPGV